MSVDLYDAPITIGHSFAAFAERCGTIAAERTEMC